MIIFQGAFQLTDDTASGLAVTGLTVATQTLVLSFNQAVALDPTALLASNWSITSGGLPTPPVILSVTLTAPDQITLTIPEDKSGLSRVLNIPSGITKLIDASAFGGPYTQAYTSVANAPIISTIVDIESQTVDVIYSENVNSTEAVNPFNYSISPLLRVQSVAKVTDNRFRLQFFDYQVPDLVYTLTASNIHDNAGNDLAPRPPAMAGFSPSSGVVGASVTLTGVDLLGATVTIGGGACTVTSNTSTSVTVTVGPAALTGSVVLTTGGGSTSLPGFSVTPTFTSFSPTSARQGDTVTIYGTGIYGATVTFGGGPAATITGTTSAYLTVTVPSGSSSGNVIVTTTGGSVSLSGFLLTPTISSFSPTAATYLGSVTITGTGLSSASSVTFGGVAGTITSNTSTSIVATVPLSAVNGSVAVTTAGGTDSLAGFTVSSTLATGLIDFWKFEANSNGELGHTPGQDFASTVAGKIGNARRWSGSNTVLSTASDMHPTREMSVSLWVKWGSFNANNRFACDWHGISAQDRWLFYDNGTGTIALYMLSYPTDNVTAVASGPITFGSFSTGTWYHLGFTYDGRYIRNYLNGALVGSAYDTGGTASFGYLNAANSAPVNLGQQDAFNPSTEDVTIDAMGLYGRTLTAAEMTELHNGGNGKEYPF